MRYLILVLISIGNPPHSTRIPYMVNYLLDELDELPVCLTGLKYKGTVTGDYTF